VDSGLEPSLLAQEARTTQPMQVPRALSGARRTWLLIAASTLALVGAGLSVWWGVERGASAAQVAEASSHTSGQEAGSPEALEGLHGPEPTPLRTTVHRKPNAGMRDDVIDPFAR
jgi:hypothetical protein